MSGRVTRYAYLKPRIMAGDLPPWLARHSRQAYIVRAALATPDWRNRDAIRELERKADWLTKATGVRYVIDHVIPLQHPTVCGLTVHNNLAVITNVRNAQKSNCLNDELFDQPEQLGLL